MATATSLKLNTTSSNSTSSNHKDCVLHHHLHHLHNLHQQTNSNTGIDSPTNTNTNIINSNNNGNNNNKPLALSSSLSSCYSSSSSTSSSISSSLASVKIKTLNGKISATNKSAGSDTSNSSPVISHNGTNNFTSSKTFTSYQFSLPAETAQSASARINSKIPFRPINMSVLKQTNDDPSSLMIVNLNEEPAASLLSLSKLERNYSYIEAMKDESLQVSQAESFFLNGKPINAQRTNEPVQPTNPAVITTAGKLLVKSKIKANKNKEKSFDIVNNNNNNNTLDEIMKNGDESHLTNNNTFLRKSHKTKQAQQQNNSHSNYANTNIEESNSQHAIKQSTSPLYSSSSTSTCSSTSSNHAKTTTPSPIPSSTLNNNNKPTEKTTCNIKTTSPQSPSSNNSSAANSNLSKSRSQSSILSLFKNTFSPFSIRKWRSKSRDKLAQQENCASPSQIAANTNNSPSASSASNNTNNKDKIYMKNQQTTNSIKLRVKPTSNTQKCFIENSITSGVQSNTTGFTSTSNNASTNASVTSTNLNHNRVVLDLVNNSNNTSNQDTNRLIINTMPETKPSEQIVFQSVSASATPTTSYRHMISQTSSSQSSPQTERQLSYLKLACFVNGYDSFTSKPKLDTNSANNSFSNELNLSSSSKLTSNNSLNNEIISQDTYVGMKSFDTLNASERFYDLKKRTTNLIKVTSQSPPNISVKSSPTNVQIDIKLETIEDSQILPVKFDDSISATVAVDQVKQDQEKELEKECPQSIHITEPAKSHQLARVIQVRPNMNSFFTKNIFIFMVGI